MIVKIRIVFLTMLSLIGFSDQLNAQHKPGQANDTLETIFHNEPHKDGYEINGEMMPIPEAIATRCDKKKIRVIGSHSFSKAAYDAKHDEDSTQVRQGRYEYIPIVNDSGKITFERRFASTGSTFSIASIATWNKQKKKWEVVFTSTK